MGKLFNAFRGFLTIILDLFVAVLWGVSLFPPKPNDMPPFMSTILGALLTILTLLVSCVNWVVYKEVIKD